MNRIGSLGFATATTALTGAAVVMAAGGTIFGLTPVPQAETKTAPSSAAGQIVQAAVRQEASPSGTAEATPEALAMAFDQGGATQWWAATDAQAPAGAPADDTPPAQQSVERATPPPTQASQPTLKPATPAPMPTAAPTSAPQAPEFPAFSAPLQEPPRLAPPTGDDGPKASSPTQSPAAAAPSVPAPASPPSSTATPGSSHDDHEDEPHEPEHEDEHDD
jgi:hypothetical protein